MWREGASGKWVRPMRRWVRIVDILPAAAWTDRANLFPGVNGEADGALNTGGMHKR